MLVFYARGDRFFYVVLTAFVMVSAIMVSYTRARAESLIGACRVGFMERPERLVLVIIGALFNRMAPVLWVIAVLSTITVIHRMRYTWTRTQDGPPATSAKAGQAGVIDPISCSDGTAQCDARLFSRFTILRLFLAY